jgi:hypothetical protein
MESRISTKKGLKAFRGKDSPKNVILEQRELGLLASNLDHPDQR